MTFLFITDHLSRWRASSSSSTSTLGLRVLAPRLVLREAGKVEDRPAVAVDGDGRGRRRGRGRGRGHAELQRDGRLLGGGGGDELHESGLEGLVEGVVVRLLPVRGVV